MLLVNRGITVACKKWVQNCWDMSFCLLKWNLKGLFQHLVVSLIPSLILSHTLRYQVIIPGSWVFSLIITFPGFLVTNFDKKIESCGETFPSEWMAKAYSLTWLLATTALPLALMVGLYSIVVHTLWFKRNDANELTYQQKVWVSYNLIFKDSVSDHVLCHVLKLNLARSCKWYGIKQIKHGVWHGISKHREKLNWNNGT